MAKLVDGVVSYFFTSMLTPTASDYHSPPPLHPFFPSTLKLATQSGLTFKLWSCCRFCCCCCFVHSHLFLNFVCLWTKVTCKERYSDLEKSIYLPSPKNGGFSKEKRTYEDGFDVTKTEEFVSLHPCAQLGAKQVISYIDLAKAKSEPLEGCFQKCLLQLIQLLP